MLGVLRTSSGICWPRNTGLPIMPSTMFWYRTVAATSLALEGPFSGYARLFGELEADPPRALQHFLVPMVNFRVREGDAVYRLILFEQIEESDVRFVECLPNGHSVRIVCHDDLSEVDKIFDHAIVVNVDEERRVKVPQRYDGSNTIL
jgi:hypothetical protein